jgi:hypothetical protein
MVEKNCALQMIDNREKIKLKFPEFDLFLAGDFTSRPKLF